MIFTAVADAKGQASGRDQDPDLSAGIRLSEVAFDGVCDFAQERCGIDLRFPRLARQLEFQNAIRWNFTFRRVVVGDRAGDWVARPNQEEDFRLLSVPTTRASQE